MREIMKLRLLTVVALLATTGLYAMQAPRSFSYSQYKFTIPANILSGMKEGEKFVITGVPATTMSELYVKDAQGNAFAKNTYSEYPGGKAGNLTYTVLSTAERQKLAKPAPAPVRAQVMPSAAATVKKAEVKPLLTLRPALQESKITEVPTSIAKQAEITKAVQPKLVIEEASPAIAPTQAVKEQAPTGSVMPQTTSGQQLTDEEKASLLNKWSAAASKKSFFAFRMSRYFIQFNLLGVERNVEQPRLFTDYIDYSKDLNDPYAASIANKLVQYYKIHLMPKPNVDPFAIVEILLDAYASDPILKQFSHTFKVAPEQLPLVEGKVAPQVVIYVHGGQEGAQKVLDRIYKLFTVNHPEIQGSGIRPRYNAKVNDLIWVAQGNGDNKTDTYKDVYELPLRAYYRSNITGKEENYHLKNPNTNQEIVD